MPSRLVLFLLLVVADPTRADESVDALLRAIRAAKGPAARAAWDKLVARGPAVLPQLLDALDTPDTVAANWFRTAFDRIVAAARKDGNKGLDADALLKVVQDAKRPGRVRRLVLEVVEELRPGTTARLTPGWLDDPEFRYEAVATRLEQADALAQAGRPGEAAAGYRAAFAASRDVTQAQTLAGRIKAQGVTVSIAEHFGFLTDWYVIGPFDGRGQKGFRTAYPPEEKIDLA